MVEHASVQYTGTYCDLSIDTPASDVVRMNISGHDVGEFGLAPMLELKKHLPSDRSIELYIDARHTKAASIEVSSEWAMWLKSHRSHFRHISMLVGSRFIQITAGFVRSFSDLGEIMRIYTETHAFDEALAESITGGARSTASHEGPAHGA